MKITDDGLDKLALIVGFQIIHSIDKPILSSEDIVDAMCEAFVRGYKTAVTRENEK